MKSRDFCFWLQGFFEITEADSTVVLTPEKAKIIKQHLSLVFKHDIDPSMGPQKHQQELNEIHGPSENILMRC